MRRYIDPLHHPNQNSGLRFCVHRSSEAPGCRVGIGETISGEYYEHEGKRYYYCETTGYGGKIGDIPEEFRGIDARIYPVSREEYDPHAGRLRYFYIEYIMWGGWLLSAILVVAFVYSQRPRMFRLHTFGHCAK